MSSVLGWFALSLMCKPFWFSTAHSPCSATRSKNNGGLRWVDAHVGILTRTDSIEARLLQLYTVLQSAVVQPRLPTPGEALVHRRSAYCLQRLLQSSNSLLLLIQHPLLHISHPHKCVFFV